MTSPHPLVAWAQLEVSAQRDALRAETRAKRSQARRQWRLFRRARTQTAQAVPGAGVATVPSVVASPRSQPAG